MIAGEERSTAPMNPVGSRPGNAADGRRTPAPAPTGSARSALSGPSRFATRRAIAGLLLLGGLLPLLVGCGSSAQSYIQPRIDFSYLQRAAVLPFDNLTRDELADDRMRSIFLSEILAAEALEIADPRETAAAVEALGLSPNTQLTPEQAVALGQSLSVDALFSATVEEYGYARGGLDRNPEITVVFALTETETGSIVWRSQVHETGSSIWKRLFGGAPDDIYEVSREAVRNALGTLL